MTYIVGAKHFGKSAIICDMAISNRQNNSVNEFALKSGVLFPGCIYGVSGNAQAARHFLWDFKSGLLAGRSILENWTALTDWCARRQPSPPGTSFELLLSSRHLGEPQFYRYHSTWNGVSLAPDFNSIGAGATVLDEPLGQARDRVIVPTMGVFNKETLRLWPGIYCTWLMQHSLSQDYDLRRSLRGAGVAGVFHYIEQDTNGERRQPEIIYILSMIDRSVKRLIYGFYKVACDEHFVSVIDTLEDRESVCGDSHSDFSARLKEWPPPEMQARAQSFRNNRADLFAFGFLDRNYFDRIFFSFPTANKMPVEMSTGRLDSRAVSIIEEAVRLPNGSLSSDPGTIPDEIREEYKAQRLALKDV